MKKTLAKRAAARHHEPRKMRRAGPAKKDTKYAQDAAIKNYLLEEHPELWLIIA